MNFSLHRANKKEKRMNYKKNSEHFERHKTGTDNVS
jgi:hypothetical protein